MQKFVLPGIGKKQDMALFISSKYTQKGKKL